MTPRPFYLSSHLTQPTFFHWNTLGEAVVHMESRHQSGSSKNKSSSVSKSWLLEPASSRGNPMVWNSEIRPPPKRDTDLNFALNQYRYILYTLSPSSAPSLKPAETQKSAEGDAIMDRCMRAHYRLFSGARTARDAAERFAFLV